ncbi:Ribosomal protein L34e superfamily protein [Zea mays]|nr:Ribosomal protein L34e superfamily protein [Zea mays]
MLRPFLSPPLTALPPPPASTAAAAGAAAMRPASSSSSRSSAGGGGAHHHQHNHGGHSISVSPPTCRHAPSSATLDLLILLLVLFSLAFLLASSLSHVARSLSPLLATPPAAAALAYATAALPYLAAAAVLVATAFLSCRRLPRRRCRNPRCRGLRKALEFDVQLQTEGALRAGAGSTAGGAEASMWREIEALPWKGGQGGNNPDYECLRAELRRMAPPNGRAVLLFRNRCGCPVAKLEGWGAPKSKRRNKK